MIWRSILAYIIVLTVGQFVTAWPTLFGLPLTMIFLGFPPIMRSRIAGFIMGVAGTFSEVVFTYYVFKWIVGDGAFGVWPFIAAIAASLQLMWHLYRMSIMSKAKFSETLDSELVLDYARARAGIWGSIGGLILGGYIFLPS